jgi:hypothetical protein
MFILRVSIKYFTMSTLLKIIAHWKAFISRRESSDVKLRASTIKSFSGNVKTASSYESFIWTASIILWDLMSSLTDLIEPLLIWRMISDEMLLNFTDLWFSLLINNSIFYKKVLIYSSFSELKSVHRSRNIS